MHERIRRTNAIDSNQAPNPVDWLINTNENTKSTDKQQGIYQWCSKQKKDLPVDVVDAADPCAFLSVAFETQGSHT